MTDPIFLGIFSISLFTMLILCFTIIGSSRTLYDVRTHQVAIEAEPVHSYEGHDQAHDGGGVYSGADSGSCDTSQWSNIKYGTTYCGHCKALADKMNSDENYRTCTAYCAAQQGGLDCVGAWEENGNSCNVRSTETCSHEFGGYTSDAICECTPRRRALGGFDNETRTVTTYELTQDIRDEIRECRESIGDARRLADGVGKDWDMWSFLSNAPEIPSVLMIVTLLMGVGWIALLRMFAVPIVFITMCTQIGMYLYMAFFFLEHGVDFFAYVYLLVALLAAAFIFYFRKKYHMAGVIFMQAATALKENPRLFITLILIYGVYALYVVLMFASFIAAAGVVEIKPENGCRPEVAPWVSSSLNFIIFQYIWTTFLYSQIRLSVVAGVVGTWYFHKDNRVIPTVGSVPKNPTLFFLKRACTTSLGTLSIGALVLAFTEWLRRQAYGRFWLLHPLGLICRMLYCCLRSMLNAITSFTTITHTFTGQSFGGSIQRAFAILRRNFVGAYVVDSAGRATIKLGIWVFSIAITMLSWYWIDVHYGWHFFSKTVGNAADSGGGGSTIYLIFCYIMMMYFQANPIVGLLFIVVIISPMAKTHSDDNGSCTATICIGEHDTKLLSIWFGFWLAMFIGTIANLVFTYIGHIIQDTVNSIFLCYAIDQDNGTVRPGPLVPLLQKMPAMANPAHVASAVEATPSTQQSVQQVVPLNTPAA